MRSWERLAKRLRMLASPDAARIRASRLFDADHYLRSYPDVAASGQDPLGHFVRAGWREGRNPHPLFDTAYYLRGNPDVAARGVNPLVHFVRAGMREGRLPSPLFEGRELPLPDSAWEAGANRVERIFRTFVYPRRERAVTQSQARTLVREIADRAAAHPALLGPDAAAIPDASLIVPVFNQLELTLWCLHAVLAGTYRCTFEIVLVDDGSQDATPEVLKQVPRIRYVRNPSNRGFVHSSNLGAQHARGTHLVFLNNDTLPIQGWLDALLDTLRDRPHAGLVGSRLIYPDGRLQEAGGIVWQNGAVWNYGRGADPRRPEFCYLRPVDFCSGAAIAVPASLFRDNGGFDEAFAPAYGEDVDLALRLRERGFEVLCQPASEVVHIEGGTSGTSVLRGAKAHQVENLRRLAEQWRIPLRPHRPEGQDPHLEKDRGAQRRALFLDAFTPRPDQDAGSLDALHWMQSLGALGFQVTFVPRRDLRHAGRYTSELQRQGIECAYSPYVESPEQILAARGGEFDLCVFYRFQVADALLPAVKRFAPQARRLLAVCDLAHVRTQRHAHLSASEKGLRASYETKLRELLACVQCDAVWTPSAWEQELLSREIPGADVLSWPLTHELHAPAKAFRDRSGMGFIGGYRHAPNVDAVLFFVSEILPIVLEQEPGMTFYVAGSHMPREIAQIEHPAVKVLGHVEDLATLFEQIRVFVAPIRFGAGLKGKIVSSLCFGVPVVGTTLALEGMDLGPEEGAITADDPAEIARQVAHVHRTEELWTRLSRAGFQRAERDYSVEAGTRHVAEAVIRIGVGTRRAQALLGCAPGEGWAGIAGMQVDTCRTRAEYGAVVASEEYRRRVGFEEALLRSAENGEVVHRACSVPAQRPVLYRAAVSVDPSGCVRPDPNWREQLVCPITRLNNRQRAMATFAQRLLEDRERPVNDVYLTEQVTPLFDWMKARFQTAHVVGSEYLGPGLPNGYMRDGIQHQDVERLGFASSSFDLIVSCDVLEHVDEPQRALAELARVLRPGGQILFTVPFHADSERNRRRARRVNGTVQHLVEPEYHENPVDPGRGSLVYFDFGWELLGWVRDAGFRDVSVLCYWSDTLAHLGGVLEAFHATR